MTEQGPDAQGPGSRAPGSRSADPRSADRGRGDVPKVVTKPPFIYLGGLVAGLLLDLVLPGDFLISPVQYPLATSFLAIGASVLIATLRRFKEAGTPVEPWKASTALVTDSLYCLTRNPLYLGVAAIYLGLGFLFDSAWIFLCFPAVMAAIHFGVVLPEERYLQRKFGTDYLRYKAAVRRWL